MGLAIGTSSPIAVDLGQGISGAAEPGSQSGTQTGGAAAQGSLGVGGAGSVQNILQSIEGELAMLANALKSGGAAAASGTAAPAASSDPAASSGSAPVPSQTGGGAPAPSSAPPTAGPAIGGGAGGSSATPSAGGSSPSGGAELGPKVPSALQATAGDIDAAAKATGVSANLLGAVALQESGGKTSAQTTNPALGLPDKGEFQVDTATFKGLQQQHPDLLGGKSIDDPAANATAAALLLKQNLGETGGDLGAALTKYNGNATSGYANDVLAKKDSLDKGTAVPGGF